MAINKSNSPVWVKVVVIVTALSFLASVAGIAALPLFEGGSTTPATSQSATSTVPPPIPGDYASLVQAADATFNEAATAQQKANGVPGADLPLWRQAAIYYADALAVRPGDPNVTTDYAIARFYSGDTTGAIEVGEAVASVNTTFAPVFFNLGVFYATNGDTAKAIELLNKVKTLKPDADLAANTDSMLKQLAGQ